MCDYLSQKIDEMYTGLTNTENLIEKKPSNMIHNSRKIEFTQSTHTKENTCASNSKIEAIDRSIFEKCEKLQAFVEKQHCYFQEPVKKHEDFESQSNILRNKLTVENINAELAKGTDITIKECNCLEIPQLKEVIIAKEEEINMLSDLVKSSKETEKKLIELKETLEIIHNENDEMKKKLQETKSIDDKTECNNKCICNKCNELNRVEYLALQKVNESYIMDIANLKRDNEIIKNEYESIQKENVELKERNHEIEKQLEFKNQTLQMANAKVEEVKNNSHKSILKINQLTDENVSLEMKFKELQNAMILKKNTVLQLETENQLLMKSCTEKCLEIQHIEDKLKMTELKLKSLTECKDSEVSKLSMLCERLKSELNETLCKYKKLQYDLEKKNSEEKERSQLEIEKCKNINESLKSTLSYLKTELDKSKLVLCEIEKQSHVDIENYKKDLEKLRWDNSHLKNDIEILTIEKNNFLSKLNVNIDEVDILQKQLKKVFTENIELRTHIEELNDNFKLMKLENEKNIERIADQEHRLKTYLKELDNANIALDVAQDDLEISKLKELKLKEDIDKMVKVFDSKMSERDIEMYNFSLVSDVDSFYDMGFDEKITFSTKCICHINKLNSFNVIMPTKTSILSKKSWNPKLAIIYETELMLSFKKRETEVNCEGCKKISHIQLNKVKINKNVEPLNIPPNNFETDMDCCLKQARFKNEYSLCLGDEINHFQLKANTDLSKNVEYFKKIVESLQKQLSVLYTQISDETIKRNTLEIQLKTLENTLKEKIDHENKAKKSEKEEMLAMKTRLQNEFRESKQCLLSELTTVRIALDEKCEEEKKLRNKCEMLLQDIETKKDEQLEKLLNRADELLSYARESRYLKYVDKGLNTKFSQGMKTKSCTFIKSESCSYDKGSTNSFPKCSFSNVASPVSMKPFICQSAATVSQSYTELYRLQLDDVIRQHRASLDIDTLHPSNKLMEELKQKYCID